MTYNTKLFNEFGVQLSHKHEIDEIHKTVQETLLHFQIIHPSLSPDAHKDLFSSARLAFSDLCIQWEFDQYRHGLLTDDEFISRIRTQMKFINNKSYRIKGFLPVGASPGIPLVSES